jgi:sugar phosphate isomerase/epimerase
MKSDTNFKIAIINDEISPNINTCIQFLKRNNIKQIDLRSINKVNILNMQESELIKLSKALFKNNIQMNMLASPLFKWHPLTSNKGSIRKFDLHHFKSDLAPKEKELFINKSIRILKIFNSNKIRIFSLIRSKDSDLLFYDQERDLYNLFISVCKKNGIEIYLENENSCIVSDKKSIFKNIKLIKELKINFLFDIGSFYAVQKNINYKEVSKIIDFTDYIHLKDYCYEKEKHVVIGEGDVPYGKIFTKLFKKDINMPMTLEMHTPKDQDSGQKSLDNIKKIISKIE